MRYLVVLLASLMLILAACGGGDDSNETEENNEETEQTDGNSGESEEDSEQDNEESTEEDTEETNEDSASGTDEQVVTAVQDYSDAMEQFQDEQVDGSTVQDMESREEVAEWFQENAPVTEKFATQISEDFFKEDGGELTWAELDYSVTFDAEEHKAYQVTESNFLVSFQIAGDAEENRGHYNYNVVDQEGEWLVNEFDFGYLDGEHPDDQEEEEQAEESSEDSEEDSDDEE
ncbi:hypothetical protein CEY16_05210 [Halalkalibacillus sediminis]|uniref:Uncharacterized protein n=1 Tax=Halalkalibacillus sediminis TaxID=2018042 RepID=A0A2I0QXU2_9BACI|nr:hypothetical protein [Halalkalibacillus sediminis]PKR79152.1 hypothetical protein CEY16_05210 [Halalkalibacillus sediminis]